MYVSFEFVYTSSYSVLIALYIRRYLYSPIDQLPIIIIHYTVICDRLVVSKTADQKVQFFLISHFKAIRFAMFLVYDILGCLSLRLISWFSFSLWVMLHSRQTVAATKASSLVRQLYGRGSQVMNMTESNVWLQVGEMVVSSYSVTQTLVIKKLDCSWSNCGHWMWEKQKY